MKSVIARVVATLFALALVAAAAYLWLRPAGGERAGIAAERELDGGVSAAPPQHDDLSREDREALRDVLRGDERNPP